MKNYTIGHLARKISRELRNNPTEAEKILWNKLRNRKLMNLKFLRQHPIFYKYNDQRNFFIADFYCHRVRVVIELDGHIHIKRRDYDQYRTEMLEFKNIIVVRFKNEKITNDLNGVLKKLIVILNDRMKELENNKF